MERLFFAHCCANAHLSINITFRDPTWAFETQKVADQRQRLKSARNVPPFMFWCVIYAKDGLGLDLNSKKYWWTFYLSMGSKSRVDLFTEFHSKETLALPYFYYFLASTKLDKTVGKIWSSFGIQMKRRYSLWYFLPTLLFALMYSW